jgi:chemotaxis signal transduction protein
MVTMVCFYNVGTAYCLPVEDARAVLSSTGLVPLPAAGRDVVGIIAGDPPIAVISPLGTSGTQILVLAVAGKHFGLLVDAVTGLCKVDEAGIQPAPDGQERKLVSGTVDVDGQLVLVMDPHALRARV